MNQAVINHTATNHTDTVHSIISPIDRNHMECSTKPQYIVRGDLYYADLSPVIGSEQGGLRPVLIIQNDTGNRHSPTVIAAAITSRTTKARIPTHVAVSKKESGLKCDSTVLLEQVRTIDRSRLKEYIGRLADEMMVKVDRALVVSLGLDEAVKTATVDKPSCSPARQSPEKNSLPYKEAAILFHASRMSGTTASSGS